MRVYFIGNSLTMSTTLDRVHALMSAHGIDMQFGSQLSGGKSLIRHKNYQSEPNQKWKNWETNRPSGGTWLPDGNMYVDAPDEQRRFGHYDQALSKHKWDKVVFQLYGGSLHRDMEAISAFIDLAESNGGAGGYYIYSTWPRREKSKDSEAIPNLDYSKEWSAPYTAAADDASQGATLNYNSRSYVDRLFDLLKAKYPGLNIRLIPVGEIIFVLDGLIAANKLPGLQELAARAPSMVPGLDEDTTFADGANVLYADAVHFNPMPHQEDSLGIFITGTSLATALSEKSPVGLPANMYGLGGPEDAALVEAVQQTIWDVMTADPRTGLLK